MRKKDKKRLLDYFRIAEPKEFFELRDRAMLLLMLNHNLESTEIAYLNLDECDRDILKTNDKKLKLSEGEQRAIVDYLAERMRRDISFSPNKEALFVDYKGRRIVPEAVGYTFKKYLGRLKEDER